MDQIRMLLFGRKEWKNNIIRCHYAPLRLTTMSSLNWPFIGQLFTSDSTCACPKSKDKTMVLQQDN